MKKHLFFCFCLLSALAVRAQNVPNGNFENWTPHNGFSYPEFWLTTDSISTFYGEHSVTRDTLNSVTGASALNMQNWTVSIETIPAGASNGNLNLSTLQFEAGSPDTVRHGMLTGMYKYFPIADTCYIAVRLTKWNGSSRDSVGGGIWSSGSTVSTFTPFSIPISYALSETPDTELIVILSAAYGRAHAGTQLYISDLSFSGIAGMNELPSNLVSINAYPNPASDYLTIEAKWNSPVKGTITILDINGKVLQNIPMANSRQRIDVSSYANGNYFYELVDEKGSKLCSAKFSINH